MAPVRPWQIFAAPDLAGPSPREVKVAPDGKRVTFLKGSLVRIDGTGVHSLRTAMRFLDRALLRRPARR